MATILTPLEFSGTQVLSRRLFRKKVLPIDSISYNGRKIDFTRDYLTGIVESFNNGAYDNVPLQFADADNRHTNDPTRYNGDVVDMSLEDDGLYVTVAATSDGAKILEENPKLGISARIVNEYDRSDGKHFPAAMQHVLATHDPRIPGLGPWSSVENYSNDDQDDILDLTAQKFGEPDKLKKSKKGKSVAKKDDGLSDAELLKLRSLLADLDEADEDGSGDNDDVTDEVESDELSEDELNELLAEVEAELEAEGESEPVEPETREPVSAGASAELSNDSEALELANQTALELSQVKAELAESRWKTEREMFMRNYGIPPALLDLAAPVLKSDGQTVELSNGETSDSSAVMRQVLTEFGKLTKVLDLGNEVGSSAEGETDENAEAAAKRDETTKALRAMMGN
jgi:hypothetical protein